VPTFRYSVVVPSHQSVTQRMQCRENSFEVSDLRILLPAEFDLSTSLPIEQLKVQGRSFGGQLRLRSYTTSRDNDLLPRRSDNCEACDFRYRIRRTKCSEIFIWAPAVFSCRK